MNKRTLKTHAIAIGVWMLAAVAIALIVQFPAVLLSLIVAATTYGFVYSFVQYVMTFSDTLEEVENMHN